jgi:hypothetical protein
MVPTFIQKNECLMVTPPFSTIILLLLQIFLPGVFIYTILYFSQVQVGICLGSLELYYVH